MKRDKLVVFWSKREKDFLIRYPRSCDGHLAYGVFCSERRRPNYQRNAENPTPWEWDPSFVKELEARGYDTTTLRFSVQRKASASTVERQLRRGQR